MPRDCSLRPLPPIGKGILVLAKGGTVESPAKKLGRRDDVTAVAEVVAAEGAGEVVVTEDVV